VTRLVSALARTLLVAAALWLAAAPAHAGEEVLTFDPEHTRVTFTLGATLHTVEGRARLERGKIEFDPESGAARGEIVVPAKSLTTDEETRDENMHRDVLESAKFPEIAFVAERLEVLSRSDRSAEVRLHGRMRIHGGEHPLAIPAQLTAEGDGIGVRARFRVPYVAWGMRDYSNFLLRVDKEVEVTVEARAAHWR